jgi:hypothetical protein
VLWVPGNHEYFDAVLQEERQRMHAAAQPPLVLLDGAVHVVDGVRFVGCTLWTDFALRIDTPLGPASDRERGIAAALRSMADYRVVRWADAGGRPRTLHPHDTIALHRTQRDWLAGVLREPFAGPTVVLTHHGPHRLSLAPRFADHWVSTAFINELPAAFFDVPVLWVHGHTHTSFDYRIGGCRVLCNPRGYARSGAGAAENPRFDARCVVTLGG